MLEGIVFEYPKVGFAVFFFFACEALCKLRERGVYFPHLGAFASVTVKPSYLLWFLKWISIALLFTALMSPVHEEIRQPQAGPGHRIVLLVDASESMRTKGFDDANRSASRFDVVKKVLRSFLSRRGGDAVGMVVFGTHSFVASPLTTDLSSLEQIVGMLHVGIAGKYSALFDAAAKAVDLLRGTEEGERIVIVLSDGRYTPGGIFTPAAVGALAKREKVRFYTVAVAAADEDTAVLRSLAEKTGGRAFDAVNAAALRAVYDEIDTLEKATVKPLPVVVKHYYYVYPLFAGFLTLLLYLFLRNRRAL